MVGGWVTTNFEGVDVVPLITQKLVFAIWGLCWYNSMFFLDVCFFCDERHSYCNTDIFFHEILWINRQKNWDSKMEIYLKNRLFDWGALNWRESGRWMGDIFGWDWSAWRMRQRFMVTKYIHSTNRSQKILSIMGFQITNAYSLLWWNFHNRSVIKAAD